jgi:ribose transport system permease protein
VAQVNVAEAEAGSIGDSAHRLADFKYRYPARYVVSWVAALGVGLLVLLVAPETFGDNSAQLITLLTGVLVFASLGQMLVIMLGAIDLSVPSIITLGAALLVHFADVINTAGAIAVALVGCGVAGLANGFLVSVMRLNSMIVTLATNGIIAGLMLAAFGQKFSDSGRAPESVIKLTQVNVGPFNVLWLLAILFSLVLGWYLNRTRFGRQLAAVGSNRTAAHLLGMSVRRVEVSAFGLAGVSYGLAGIALAGWLTVPDTAVGGTYALATITTVAVAGAMFSGGPASVSAVNVAGLVLVLLAQALQTKDLGAGVGYVVQGVILVLAVALLTLSERGREVLRRVRRRSGVVRTPSVEDVRPMG